MVPTPRIQPDGPPFSLRLGAILLLTLYVALLPGIAGAQEQSQRSAIVRISASLAPVDVFEPWKRGPATPVLGSGVLLEDGRILTNAHVVQDAVSVRVRQEGDPRSFDGQVVHVQPQVDLALVVVDDGRFNASGRGIELGGWPPLQKEVEAFGYPEGGQGLSVTAGVVSRVERNLVVHSFEWHAMLQTDAAINSGNSGGPLVADGRCVALNTQSYEGAENVAYSIPAPVIRQFLEDVEDGVVDGVPEAGVALGTIENPAELRFWGLPEDAEGLLVMEAFDGSPAADVLQRGDLLTKVAGHAVAGDGMVDGPQGLRLDASWYVEREQVGDRVEIRFLREGVEHTEDILLTERRRLVASCNQPEREEYFIYGGAQFQPLTVDFAMLFGEGGMPPNLSVPWYDDYPSSPDQRQLVVLSRVLPHPLNRGYEEMVDLLVATVDEVPPRDLEHFVDLVENGQDEYVRIRFATKEEMVFDRDEVYDAGRELLDRHGVPRDRFVLGDERGSNSAR